MHAQSAHVSGTSLARVSHDSRTCHDLVASNPRTLRSRAFLLTRNNYQPSDIVSLNNHSSSTIVRYSVWAAEVGKQGTPHIHAFFYYKNARSKISVIQDFPDFHVDLVQGTPSQARHYVCKLSKKSDPREKPITDIHEAGDLPVRGYRSDIKSVCEEIIEDKKNISDIALDYPSLFVQYGNGFRALANHVMKDRSDPPIVRWLWGATGVGKTRYAFDHHESVYIKDGTRWWDNYVQQVAIVIDDFDGEWPYRDLLRLLDRYPYQGQIKGGYVKINSPFIYITCEFAPTHFWSGNELAQVQRRLTDVIELI